MTSARTTRLGALALFGGLLLAPPWAMATDYTIQICEIQATSGDVLLLRPCGGWTSKNGCSNTWIAIPKSAPGEQVMYTAALTAFSLSRDAVVRMDGVSCEGYDVTWMIRIK